MMYTFNQYYLVTHIVRKNSQDTYLSYLVNKPEQKVILKIYDPECMAPDISHKDFQYIGNLFQHLSHPHIVPVLDIGLEQDKPYVVSAYFSQGSLRQHLEHLAPDHLRLDDALRIVFDIGEALRYAHKQNLIHQNIKPENIFLNLQGEASLADFSLKEIIKEFILDSKPDDRTISYMAPEQLAGHFSASSDQYALGCLLYELVTGVLPFTIKDFSYLWQNYTMEAPTAPSQIVPGLAKPLEAVILKALSKKPMARYPDIDSFLHALKAASQPKAPDFPFSHIMPNQKNPGSQRHIPLPESLPPLETYFKKVSKTENPPHPEMKLDLFSEELPIPTPDPVTQERVFLADVDPFSDVEQLSNPEVAPHVQDVQVDVLVDVQIEEEPDPSMPPQFQVTEMEQIEQLEEEPTALQPDLVLTEEQEKDEIIGDLTTVPIIPDLSELLEKATFPFELVLAEEDDLLISFDEAPAMPNFLELLEEEPIIVPSDLVEEEESNAPTSLAAVPFISLSQATFPLMEKLSEAQVEDVAAIPLDSPVSLQPPNMVPLPPIANMQQTNISSTKTKLKNRAFLAIACVSVLIASLLSTTLNAGIVELVNMRTANNAIIHVKPTATPAQANIHVNPTPATTPKPSPVPTKKPSTGTTQPGASTHGSATTTTANIPTIVPTSTPTPTPTLVPTPVPIPTLTSFSASGGSSYDTATNLTSIGSVDWVHWGYPSAASTNRKSGVAQWISSAAWSGTLSTDTSQSIDFTWSDGTPYASQSILTSGTDTTGGGSFTVKSNQTVHTLRVYVGAYLAIGTLNVAFGGQIVYAHSFDMTNDGANGGDNTGFTIAYSSNVPSHITLSYTMTASDGNKSYVILEAATLS